MRKRLAAALFSAALTASIPSDAAALSIIALSPQSAENLASVGARDEITAVDSATRDIGVRPDLPAVSFAGQASLEEIAARKPDLIVADKTFFPALSESLQKLTGFGIKIHLADLKSLDDLPGELITLGRLTGHEEQAEKQSEEFRKRLGEVRERYRTEKKIGTVFLVGSRPLIAATGVSYLSGMLGDCGARNILSDLPGSYSAVNTEEVIRRRPELVIDTSPEQDEKFRKMLSENGSRYLFIGWDPDIIHITVKSADGLSRLCRKIAEASAKGR